MALTIAKRCKFCGYKLIDGKCKHEGCIDYTPDEAKEDEAIKQADKR